MSQKLLGQVLHILEEDFAESLDRLFALLRFQSVSTDTAFKEECRKTADWLAQDLQSLGFEAKSHATQGHPIIVAHERSAGASAPHILFYGHYDVQPVDPISLWKHDPFVPRIEDRGGSEVIAARGASDDKGQLMTFIEALRAFKKAAGRLPLNVTILLEGEEECGSSALEPFLRAHSEELKADCALICDTSMWDRETPSVTMSLRGMVGEDICVKAAKRDLHSGYYGGAAVNPIAVLAKILADMRDENGAVTIPHFYDGVEETAPELLAEWAKLQFDSEHFLKPVGLSAAAGEKERVLAEQVWARPTAEINGIGGGYQGEGFKTVIPAEAHAKVSFRLVHKQNPQKIRENFRRFVRERLPADCSVEFRDEGASPALNLSPNSPWVQPVRQALSEEWGKPAVLTGSGGSIPIANDFKEILGVEPLFVGFALDDDCIHSPNEKYELRSFRKGQRSWARIIAALANMKKCAETGIKMSSGGEETSADRVK